VSDPATCTHPATFFWPLTVSAAGAYGCDACRDCGAGQPPFTKGAAHPVPGSWRAVPKGPIVNPRLILLGHARHGKDTVADLLRDRHGFNPMGSSLFACERVVAPWFRLTGWPYPSVQACYADRVNHRALWFDLICAYNRQDPARLARELFEAGHDVYVGMRSATEFAAARPLADVVVWVDALDRLPPEPADSFDIDPAAVCDWRIDNNGTPELLAERVSDFVRWLRAGRPFKYERRDL
jgi:hypothetical protein